MLRHQIKDVITKDLPFAAVVAVLVGLLLWALLTSRALGADPTFTVVNKTSTAFVVTNKVPAFVVTPPALPTDPNAPAPAGYQWERWPGENWKLVKVSASEVAPRPFPLTPTLARPVGESNTAFGAATAAEPTPTGARWMGRSGATNCSPAG